MKTMPEATLKCLRTALGEARGKIRVSDAQLLAGANPSSYHEVSVVGHAMQQLGWKRRRCRFDGMLLYGYVKGTPRQMELMLGVGRRGRKLVVVPVQVTDQYAARSQVTHAEQAQGVAKIKVLDARKKHPVKLTFLLDKKISPQELAQKLANRCGGYELMPGEAILVEHGKIACVVTDETLSLPHFGWQWRTSPKAPKHPKLTRNQCK